MPTVLPSKTTNNRNIKKIVIIDLAE